PMNVECVRTFRKFVRINQAAAGFVVGVGGKVIPTIELAFRANGFSKGTYQAMHFLLRGFGSGDCIGARQSRQVLSKAVPRNEGVKIFRRTEIVGIVVPSAHV